MTAEEFVLKKRMDLESRKQPAMILMRTKVNAYRKRAEDLKSKLPKFDVKDAVIFGDNLHGIIKKVEGVWDEKLKRVISKYKIQVVSENGRKVTYKNVQESEIISKE